MRTLSSALSSALGSPVQRPALLVRVDFPVVAYWSNYATLTWNGQTWTRTAFDVTGLQVSALEVEGELVVDRASATECQTIMSQGMQDRAITIYGYDAAATATGDVVWLASAVGGAVVADMDSVRVALRHPAQWLASPRRYITSANGFTTLLGPDASVKINNIVFTMNRRN